MTVAIYGMILAAVAFEVLGQICFKRAALSGHRSAGEGGAAEFWIAVARSGWTYAGFCAYGTEVFVWVAALHFAPLSQAFPLMSLTYCGVALASRLFLNERISARTAAGIALITLGAACLVGASL